MSDFNSHTHTVRYLPETHSSSETQRVVRTGRASFSNTTRTMSDHSDQSFTDRGQIMSRHRRRITLSPSTDEDTQSLGWGDTTLVSTTQTRGQGGGGDKDDDDDGYDDVDEEWHETRSPINAGEYIREITTLRYNPDNTSSRESLDWYPPERNPRRSMSVDRQLDREIHSWGSSGNLIHTASGGTRTVLYDPDVLRWQEIEPSVHTSLPRASSHHRVQPLQRAQSQGVTRSYNDTSTEMNRGNIDDNIIEEVVRTIHASRTQQTFPGTVAHNAQSASGSSYDDDLLLSGEGPGRHGTRIPRLSLTANTDSNSHLRDRTIANRQSQETNRDTFGSRQMSSGQLRISTADFLPAVEHLEHQQQESLPQHRSASHIPKPIDAKNSIAPPDGGSSSSTMITNSNNNNLGIPLKTQRKIKRTSITRIPGPNIVDVSRRGSDSKLAESHRLSMARNDGHSQGRNIERGSSGVSSWSSSRQDVQQQSDSGLQESRKLDFADGARYTGGLSKTSAAHSGSSNSNNTNGSSIARAEQQDSGRMATENHSATQRSATGGHAVRGILAAAQAAEQNKHQAMLEIPQQNTSNADSYKVDSSNNTQVCTTAGSSSSSYSPHSQPSCDEKATSTRIPAGLAATTSPGPHHHDYHHQQQQRSPLPPASAHHGNHAIFANLPEPDKAHHAPGHNHNNNNHNHNHGNHNKSFGFRFREASLSTVGSIFKPDHHNQRRQSSVTMVSGDDGDDHHRGRQPMDAERYRDEAWDFLLKYRTERIIVVSRQPSYLRRLRWRIDLHLMLFLFLAWLLTFSDKILFNYARVMGILYELGFTTNDFADASSYFYVASLASSLPHVFLLAKMPLGKLLAVDLIGWGICTALHATLRNWGGLVTLRVLGGLFEAGIMPALILLTAQYFTWREQPIRFAYWFSGMGVAQMLSGLLSWAFQHMDPRDKLSSWKTMYLLLGLLTVILGILVFFLVPANPMKAKFLHNEEKVALIEHIKINQTGIVNKRFHPQQVVQGLFDLGIWFLGIIVVLQLVSGGLTLFYSVTMLNGFGYSAERSALLNMPVGAINLVTMFLFAIFVRFWGMRWVVVSFAGIISAIGAALLFGLTSYGDDKRALLAGLYLISFTSGATMITVYWLSCNVAGHTKRAYAAAVMNAAYALGAIIGPQTFRHQAVPGYRSAKMVLVITMAVTVVLAPLAAGYFWFKNRRRDGKHEGSRIHEDDLDDATALAGLTDKENKAFRYRL